MTFLLCPKDCDVATANGLHLGIQLTAKALSSTASTWRAGYSVNVDLALYGAICGFLGVGRRSRVKVCMFNRIETKSNTECGICSRSIKAISKNRKPHSRTAGRVYSPCMPWQYSSSQLCGHPQLPAAPFSTIYHEHPFVRRSHLPISIHGPLRGR